MSLTVSCMSQVWQFAHLWPYTSHKWELVHYKHDILLCRGQCHYVGGVVVSLRRGMVSLYRGHVIVSGVA